ncbi:MAG: transporter [Candidatus Eremiobacteraeota bacterium]|nr:transporter [Candidatus Eremiobacteraeota bacterium]
MSDLGGQLTAFALPTIAIVTLGASPLSVGSLQAFEFAVVPLLATVAGVLADRHPRKALMIGANVVRALALSSLPLAWWFHDLGLIQFFIVGGICAAAGVLFDTAYQALLPALTGRDDYQRGVARLAMSGSVAEAVGTGSAGAIVQFVGAPLAIVLNLFTFVASTVTLLRIRVPQTPPRGDAVRARGSKRKEARAGFELVFRDRLLRSVALSASTAYLGGAMVTSVFTLYCYRELHMTPVEFGLIMGLANLGLAGALISNRAGELFGARRTLAGATLLSALRKFVFLCHAAPLVAVFIGRLLLSFTGPISSTTQQALQTARVPDEMLGRMNAAMRTIVWAALPIGSFLGGAIANVGGTGLTIAIGSTISLCAAGWLAIRPSLESVEPREVEVAA